MILGLESATRIRPAAGTWGADGRWTDGSTSSTSIQVSLQAATPQQLATLPEGERTRDPRMIYTSSSTPLRALSQHDGYSADRVQVGSVVYEVREVADWRSTHPIPHCAALVVRYQEPDATMPDGKLEDLLQAVRDVLKTALGLGDDEVICYAAQGGGPRPALPYYAVRVVGDALDGTDWTLEGDDGGDTTITAEGNRSATVSVFGYGASTSAGLEAFASALALPTAIEALAGFALDPDGAIVSAPQLLDTGLEQRFQRDFSARYIQRSTSETLATAEHLVFAVDVTTPVGTSPVEIDVTVDAP